MEGWIKAHRRLTEKGWYKKSEYVHLWLHILFKANHKEKEFWFNGQNIKVKRGQFVTGRDRLSDETGISTNKIERILKQFKNEQQIEQQTSNRNRLITVVCYDQYQKNEQPTEQQLNNQWTTSEQPVDTNKKERIKEVKKERKKKEDNTAKQVSLHSILRKDFEKRYLDEVESKYYWTAADGTTLKQMISKIKHLVIQKKEKTSEAGAKIEVLDQDVIDGWNLIFNKMPKWYAEKGDLKIINSKFNEIVREIKSPYTKGKRMVEDLYREFGIK